MRNMASLRHQRRHPTFMLHIDGNTVRSDLFSIFSLLPIGGIVGRLLVRKLPKTTHDHMSISRHYAVDITNTRVYLRLESGGSDSCGMQKPGAEPPLKFLGEESGSVMPDRASGLFGVGKMKRVAYQIEMSSEDPMQLMNLRFCFQILSNVECFRRAKITQTLASAGSCDVIMSTKYTHNVSGSSQTFCETYRSLLGN